MAKQLFAVEAAKPKGDLHADAFRAAYDASFPVPYKWSKGDFVQLAKWRKQYDTTSPSHLVRVAKSLWAKKAFTPRDSLTIAGLCAHWSTLAAMATQQEASREQGRTDSQAGRSGGRVGAAASDPAGYSPSPSAGL